MIEQNGRAFNEWLRAQLKVKKMSQRQLAQQSGVDHSTISRLIRGDRMPSLGTATKLARGLREIHDDAEPPQYLGVVSAGTTNPVARVEYALRSDDLLSEPDVRQVMEYYLSIRLRRFGSRGRAMADGAGDGPETPSPIRPHVWSAGPSAVPRVGLANRGSLPARPVPRSGRQPGRY
jgi:transcriptional regulator with XRE-family HTH domain